MTNDPMLDYLDAHLDEYIADLRHLSGIDSGSDDKPGIDAVQEWLATRLGEIEFAVERVPHERWGDDLVARRHGQGRGRVLLLGHADTVYPHGTAALRPLT